MSTENNEVAFLQGFIFKRPHQNAPAFVKGSMSIKVDEAIETLKKYADNGWVNADLLASKDNSKLYFKVNTYKPEKKDTAQPEDTKPTLAGEDTRDVPDIDVNSIPF